jgi:4-aminobutyrate aminotransferase-like enzyme/Ser/Thr protein kinase RdoA (MazF antagonist)
MPAMSLLDQAPRLSVADAEQLARELYGLDARAEPLPSERDQNFCLDAACGRFVLKVANLSDSEALIRAQTEALGYLASRIALCPRVVPSLSGDLMSRGPLGHLVRLLTWRPGAPLATVRHHAPSLLQDIGRGLGELDRYLAEFDHPALHRDFHWDLAGAIPRSRELLPLVNEAAWRGFLARELDAIDGRLRPTLGNLRTSIIHNDANDYNVLIERDVQNGDRLSGLVDFGDMVHSYTVGDAAVAIAYVVLDKPDPLTAAGAVLAGYHGANPLTDDEIDAVFDLAKLRLCLSAAIAARQCRQRPGDDYLGISQDAVRRTLPGLTRIPPRFAQASLRHACGLPSAPRAQRIQAWLNEIGAGRSRVPVVGDGDLAADAFVPLDLSVASPLVAGDPAGNAEPAMTRRITDTLASANARIGVGGYLEPRTLYTSPLFAGAGTRSERRTVHLGLDLFAPAGTSVRTPLPGAVHALADNAQPLDYGPVVILRHRTAAGDAFFTLYGHLSRESLAALETGVPVSAGDRIGAVGGPDVNGGWTPHLHFQVITDLLDRGCDFPGVCAAHETGVWSVFSPDPAPVAGIPEDAVRRGPARTRGPAVRSRPHVGGNVRLAYREPFEAVRGWMQYLYDDRGRRFLDAYNNVPHVGHCHPAVVHAAAQQMRVLNTNTRYLHDSLEHFAGQLVTTLPPPLSVCYFVNSGSEANELALRLAWTYTGRRDVVVLEAGYHGNTSTLIDVSPYKFEGPGGEGRRPWVHVAPLPDLFRGRFRGDDPLASTKYADEVGSILDDATSKGRGAAAFLAETCPSVAGQIILPPGYLSRVYGHVRSAGGVCIADEVQTAYGRMGTHFYAFESHGVVPDIVVLGKPIGNGHPLGAVITRPDIAEAFDNGMEFFSTFGGSTVSCAVGLAVLDVVRTERLQDHAARVGRRLVDGLHTLAARHALVGDVRGSGLFLGVELVRDAATRHAASAEADYVVNRLREEGVLIGTDGPHHNVLKIRPPMPFDDGDADQLVGTLDRLLGELD